ncbi:uncharacterized protein FA14DRAFT_159102 [Meira miltonrushii]|uniref:HOOK-domain-containing protein n=1 Tax=Meira miltonrushii TaxID=1280837 RepID=A0A316VGQ4_9BASI|nr:uncharacterized protein FA14DRAFT_159102 [Meira miltonrushii]PWN36690.1 hypothetical protein FA14DRAFT_159102 [Meira miltonrushii]
MEERDPIQTGQDPQSSISQEEKDANDSGSSSLPNLEGEVRALTAWVQAVDRARGADSFLSRTVDNPDDLSDGVAFFEILSTIDSTYFRNPHGGEVKDNWILKTATLKRLFKLVTQYYIEVLQQSPSALDVPDLDALARDGSKQDLYKLGSLVIGIAVRSDQANEHIAAIQSLPLEDQQQLMYTIEQVMGALQPIESAEGEDNNNAEQSISQNLLSEEQNDQSGAGSGELKSETSKDNSAEMERVYAALLDENRILKNSLEDAQAEKEETAKEHTRFREEVERDRNVQADVLMRQEIERLKASLRRSEDNLAEAESEVERLNASVLDLTKKSEELQRKTEENAKMKDELEELRHASDKLQRTENAMEKFKKKLEEASEVKRQLKTLEAQNAELVDRNAAVEDEYKRVAHFKPLMDSYKEQIAALETKASNLQRDLNSARYDGEQVSVKLRATEEARTKEKEELDLYQERIQELELGGSVAKQRASTGGVNGSDGMMSSTDVGSDEDVDENLEDAMSGTTMAGLKIQVRKLARELKVAQANKADASRLLVVENLLQDANKMKERYERDYLKEYQKNMKIQKQMEAIQEGKSDLGDGAEANLALRMRLNETVEELDKTKKALGDLEVEHEQTRKELTIAKSDLTLVGKDKLEMIEEVRAEVNVEKAELERTMKQLQEEKASKEEQIRMQLSQINTLLMEKVDLQNDSIEQRDGALQRELEMGDLRSKAQGQADKELAAKSEAQIRTLQEKLQKARTFIRQQDKMIKDAANAKAKGQIAPEELVKRARLLEQENKVLRLEQRLISSIYYDQKQKEIRNAINASGALSNSGRSQTKAGIDINGLKPRSWLMQQRTQLAGGINLARR